MLTKTQLKTTNGGARGLKKPHRERACPKGTCQAGAYERPAGRVGEEERPASAGTLRLEMVKCGKERCKKCREGPAHGPYWYLYFRKNGRLKSRYIGKMIPDDLEVQGA